MLARGPLFLLRCVCEDIEVDQPGVPGDPVQNHASSAKPTTARTANDTVSATRFVVERPP
jgi:hypothetical protein